MWRINNYQRFKFRIKLPVRYNMPNLVRKKKPPKSIWQQIRKRNHNKPEKNPCSAVQMHNNSWIFNPLMESVACGRKIHSSAGNNNHMFHIRSGLIVLTFAFFKVQTKYFGVWHDCFHIYHLLRLLFLPFFCLVTIVITLDQIQSIALWKIDWNESRTLGSMAKQIKFTIKNDPERHVSSGPKNNL